MFRNEEVKHIVTYVICDKCGSEVQLGKNLGRDDRMYGALCYGFTYKQENGVFKNYCWKCREEQS